MTARPAGFGGGVKRRGRRNPTLSATATNSNPCTYYHPTKSISRYETGASVPSIKTLLKIAKVLKRPAGYFLDE